MKHARIFRRLHLIGDDDVTASTDLFSAVTFLAPTEAFERMGAVDVLPLGYDLSLTVYDADVLAQLDAWQAAGTLVQALIEGESAHLLFYHAVAPVDAPDEEAEPGMLYGRRVRLTTADSGASVHDAVVNLLAIYGWGGLTAAPAAYTIAPGGFGALTLAGGVGTFTVDQGAETTLSASVLAPVAGRIVRASFDVAEHDFDSGQGGADTLSLRVTCLDADDVVIASASQTITDADAGVIGVQMTAPFGTHSVRWSLVGEVVVASDRSITFYDPTLRLGGGSTAPVAEYLIAQAGQGAAVSSANLGRLVYER